MNQDKYTTKNTTAVGKKPKRFVYKERAAMQERARQRRAEGENAVLAKIAALVKKAIS